MFFYNFFGFFFFLNFFFGFFFELLEPDLPALSTDVGYLDAFVILSPVRYIKVTGILEPWYDTVHLQMVKQFAPIAL